MAKQPKQKKCELSPIATKTRSEYYRTWRANNKAVDRATKQRYWEKKAQAFYGADYIPPESSDELSPQAKEVRRRYYAEYRNNNPETINKANQNFWERKAKTND